MSVKFFKIKALSHSSSEGRGVCLLALNLIVNHTLGWLDLVCHKSSSQSQTDKPDTSSAEQTHHHNQ